MFLQLYTASLFLALLFRRAPVTSYSAGLCPVLMIDPFLFHHHKKSASLLQDAPSLYSLKQV